MHRRNPSNHRSGTNHSGKQRHKYSQHSQQPAPHNNSHSQQHQTNRILSRPKRKVGALQRLVPQKEVGHGPAAEAGAGIKYFLRHGEVLHEAGAAAAGGVDEEEVRGEGEGGGGGGLDEPRHCFVVVVGD